MAHNAVVRSPGEGDAYWVLGGLYELKVSSDESKAAVTVMQFTIPEGMGPPPHVHDGGETVTVVDGRAGFRFEGDTVELSPGSVVHFPAGTQETFEPSARCVSSSLTRRGIDEFFAASGEPAKSGQVPPPPESPPDLERLAALAEGHGLRLLPSRP